MRPSTMLVLRPVTIWDRHQRQVSPAEFVLIVAAHLGDDGPERKIVYEDPELGFCTLAHVNHGARDSKPHDDRPSWAIYGQAEGESIMSDWALVVPASENKPGRVRLVREYRLRPRMSVTRAISIRRAAPIRPS